MIEGCHMVRKMRFVLFCLLGLYSGMLFASDSLDQTAKNAITLPPLYSLFLPYHSLELQYTRELNNKYFLFFNPQIESIRREPMNFGFGTSDSITTFDSFLSGAVGVQKLFVLAQNRNSRFGIYPKGGVTIGRHLHRKSGDNKPSNYTELFGGPMLGAGIQFQRKRFLIEIVSEHVFDFGSSYNAEDWLKFKPTLMIGWVFRG